MKYKDRDTLVASLRELADFVEARGIVLPRIDVHATLRIPSYDPKTYEETTPAWKKRLLKKVVRTMKPVKKEYLGSSIYVSREFGKIKLTASANREAACRMVKTGNKIIHAAQVIPQRVEEEVEWICTDPLLKASSE